MNRRPAPTNWKTLYRIGGIAALIAALLFRRNFGAEVSLFTGMEAIPQSAAEWFALLQEKPFVGLSFLSFFDLLNYALLGVIFLALAAALWQANKGSAALALAGGLVGISVSFSGNISITMLSLSQQYAAATTEMQKAGLQAAGQALLASNNAMGNAPSTGVIVSLLLIALATLLFSIILLPTSRATAIFGMIAGACDLVYCLTFAFIPMMGLLMLPIAGLCYMIWHILIARKFIQLSKESV